MNLIPRPIHRAPAPLLKTYTVHYTTRAGFRASTQVEAQTRGEASWTFSNILPTGRINLITLCA